MNIKNTSKNQGFTILETIVAIAILLLSIAGPLTVADKALTEAVTSQDQMTASYLAQDLMEYVKNVRDDNLLADSSSWLVSANGTDLSACTVSASTPCDFDTGNGLPSSPSIDCTPSGQNLCQIYINSITAGETSTLYYTPYESNATVSTSKFSRAFTVSLPSGETSANATSSVVTVTVAWKTGGVANQVIIRDILFDTKR